MPARLLPVTHLPQGQPADCVAACAAMVLGYLGLPQDYDQLNRLLGIDPLVGAPFRNLRRLASLGIDVAITEGTLAGLAEQLTEGRAPIALLTTGDLPYWPEDAPHAERAEKGERKPLCALMFQPTIPAPSLAWHT